MAETKDLAKELVAAEIELHTLGYIEFKNDEVFHITAAGIDKARQIINRMPVKERILIMTAVPELIIDGDDGEEEIDVDDIT